jgi:PAS domain S-box-containing protein
VSFFRRVFKFIRSFGAAGDGVDESSRLWLMRMLDYLPKPFFLLDFEQKRITFTNAAARRMMGMEYAANPSAQVYLKSFSLYDSQGKLLVSSELPSARVLRGEKINGELFELATTAGRFSVKVFSEDIPAMYGQGHSALIVFQDVTALKKTEKDLRRAQADLNEAIDIAQIGFWSVDLTTGHTALSRYLLMQFGLTEETFDGTLESALSAIHSEDRDRVRKAIEKSIAEGTSYHLDYRVVHPSGDIRWIEAKSGSAQDRAWDLNRYSGTTLDVTERVKARRALEAKEQDLKEALKVAEDANSAKSQFLANMSHEIRTPLGAIMGFVGLLKESDLAPAERAEYVSVIERNSTQLMRIIDDILDLSKVEAGMMLIENIDFSLPELLTDFSSLIGFKAREKGILLKVQAVTPLPTLVNSDPTRLRQILLNVVGNAIKFTDAGSVIVRVRFIDDYLEFEVEDSGRGISSQQAANLFQAFTQADASTTRHYGGTGLGLVLSRSLAEAMGGTFILKHSELGKGSVFVIRVRATAASSERLNFGPNQEEISKKTRLLDGIRVLLVEDSPDNQALISIYLTKAGAKVEVASDGEQGIQQALSAEYEVVLMDVQMPTMDGITAVAKLRSLKYSKPVIALTAHAMKDERDRCLKAGFTDFLSKPINREELIWTIREYSHVHVLNPNRQDIGPI